MHLSQIHIENYRNFNNFTMNFQQGLNVILGANNSGKTGLLYAINLLKDPSKISVNDFNRNNLIEFSTLYLKEAPSILIEYTIEHTLVEGDEADESIIRLLPFLEVKKFSGVERETDHKVEYHLSAKIRAAYSLDVKHLGEYRKEVEKIGSVEDYLLFLARFIEKHYAWSYTNGASDTKAEQKAVTSIFDIRFIEAERTSEEVRKETKREIEKFSKNIERAAELDGVKQKLAQDLEKILKPSIEKLNQLFENEHNEIGLAKGNVAIASSMRPTLSVSDAYTTEVKDTKKGYALPLDHNGLGYNNLINIYMLIKLTEIQKGKDFKVLCLEEPEAHLHPAMQYKLFKYLCKLDREGGLNQQIFVTTHSSNISAVAGLDNMFMMAYDREITPSDCKQQQLKVLFDSDDEAERESKIQAKKHLTKFLDVTRSDMLFADKVILVEGIAERLLLPYFMEKCEIPYEDEHISIVEIGGKHFEHFIEIFKDNEIKKKVLCITDKDFKWINEEKNLKTKSEYDAYAPLHISGLNLRFPIDNLKIVTQSLGGTTFEDELFLANIEEGDQLLTLFKLVTGKLFAQFIEKYRFNFKEWLDHKEEIDGRSLPIVEKYLNRYDNRSDKSEEMETYYQKLFFAELFLYYAKNQKGNLALNILTEETFMDENGKILINVPGYIKEGLRWLIS